MFSSKFELDDQPIQVDFIREDSGIVAENFFYGEDEITQIDSSEEKKIIENNPWVMECAANYSQLNHATMNADEFKAVTGELVRLMNHASTQGYVLESAASGPAAQRLQAQWVLEGVGDYIKKGVDALKRWVSNFVNWVISIFQRRRTSAAGVVKRAKRIIDEGQKCKAKKIKDNAKEIDSHILAEFFAATPDAQAAGNAYQLYLGDVGENLATEFSKQAVEGLKKIAQDVESGVEIEKIYEATDAIIGSLIQGPLKKFKEEKKGETQLVSYSLPYAYSKLVLVLDVVNGKRIGLKSTLEKETKQSKAQTHLPILSGQDITELARLVEKQMLYGVYAKYDGIQTEIERGKKLIDKVCDSLTKKMQKEKLSRADSFSMSFLQSIMAAMQALVVAVNGYDLQCATYLLDWCEKSTKMYA